VRPIPARSLCSVCGQPGASTGGLPRCRNSWCAGRRRALESLYWVGAYEGSLRRAIVAYKYRSDLRWARPFGSLLHAFLARHSTWFEEVGVLCPVPTFLGAGARRNWGHVELICAELSRVAGAEWPVEHLVVKSGETAPMCGRSHGSRRRVAGDDLPHALRVQSRGDVAGRRILLVDDVCASGETLLAVAGVLRGAGAAEVSGLVLARASWRPPPREGAGP
jgi:predicted amidophosphoribosyltransferase